MKLILEEEKTLFIQFYSEAQIEQNMQFGVVAIFICKK